MPRLHAVAYDVRAESPAQPRVAAWLRGCLSRGMRVTLYTEQLPGEWAESLTREGGLRVHVVADPVRRAYSAVCGRTKTSAATAGASPGRAEPEGRLWRLGRLLQSRLLFPDPQAIWSRRIRRTVVRRLEPGDAVLTCSRPESVGCVGEAVQDRGATWWFDFADGWCFQGLRPDAMTPGPRRDREVLLEARHVGRANVVSTVDDILAAAFARLRPAGDVVVYPNIIPDSLVLPVDSTAAARERLCLAHFGRLSLSDPERSLRPLMGALAGAASVAFRFFGDFNDRDRQELHALSELGHDIEVRAPLPREEIAARRDQFDGTLMIASRDQRGSSSKLLDSLGLALPVFAIVPDPSIAARIVRDCGAGEVLAFEALERGPAVWTRYCEGIRLGRYRVDPLARARYTSEAFVPALVERMIDMMTRAGSLS